MTQWQLGARYHQCYAPVTQNGQWFHALTACGPCYIFVYFAILISTTGPRRKTYRYIYQVFLQQPRGLLFPF